MPPKKKTAAASAEVQAQKSPAEFFAGKTKDCRGVEFHLTL